MMIASGVNDPLFPGAGMKPPADMSEIEFHPIDSGHFALEDHCGEIAALTRSFLDRVFGPARRLSLGHGSDTHGAAMSARWFASYRSRLSTLWLNSRVRPD